jgi:uncharacterized protein (DUF952 family)
MIKLANLIEVGAGEKYLYHITKKSNISSIKKNGLLPNRPTVDEPHGIYLFKSKTDAAEALMNWLGTRFEENDELVLLTIDPNGLKIHPSTLNANYEVISYDSIPPKNIVKVEDADFPDTYK